MKPSSCLALDKCNTELTQVLRDKNAVQISLHSCAKRQIEMRNELELEKSALSDLVDERNVEIINGQETIESVERKLQASEVELEKGNFLTKFDIIYKYKWEF